MTDHERLTSSDGLRPCDRDLTRLVRRGKVCAGGDATRRKMQMSNSVEVLRSLAKDDEAVRIVMSCVSEEMWATEKNEAVDPTRVQARIMEAVLKREERNNGQG